MQDVKSLVYLYEAISISLRVFRSVHPSKRSPFLRHYKEPPVTPLTSQQRPQRHRVAPLVRKTEKVGKDGVGGGG